MTNKNEKSCLNDGTFVHEVMLIFFLGTEMLN